MIVDIFYFKKIKTFLFNIKNIKDNYSNKFIHNLKYHFSLFCSKKMKYIEFEIERLQFYENVKIKFLD